jgi:putative membrane protein
MKLIRTILSLVVMILIIAACSRDARHGVDSQDENDDKNGVGVARDNDDEADTTARNDSVSRENNSSNTNTRQPHDDADFLIAAADGGMLEVQLGELAKQNASSADVKEFARTMTIDHGKANAELKNLASKLRIDVPTRLSEKSQQKYNELSQKKGKEFDDAYSKLMVQDHQETIEKFRAESNNGQQHEIRTWAEAKIPNLQHHLEMAQKMNNGGNASRGQ